MEDGSVDEIDGDDELREALLEYLLAAAEHNNELVEDVYEDVDLYSATVNNEGNVEDEDGSEELLLLEDLVRYIRDYNLNEQEVEYLLRDLLEEDDYDDYDEHEYLYDAGRIQYYEQQRQHQVPTRSTVNGPSRLSSGSWSPQYLVAILVGLGLFLWFGMFRRLARHEKAYKEQAAIIQELLADEDNEQHSIKRQNVGRKKNKSKKRNNNNKVGRKTAVAVKTTEDSIVNTSNKTEIGQIARVAVETTDDTSNDNSNSRNNKVDDKPIFETTYDTTKATTFASGSEDQQQATVHPQQSQQQSILTPKPAWILQQEEEQMIQQVLNASLLAQQEEDSSPSPTTVTTELQQEKCDELEKRRKQREELEAEAAERRKREADESRLRKQLQREAEMAKLTKRKKRQAEQAKLRKLEQLQAEQARQQADRRDFWKAQVEYEEDRIQKLVLLLACECCLNTQYSHSLSSARLLQDSDVKAKLEAQARQILRDFFDDYDNQVCRTVIVKGSRQQDAFEGRSGTIQAWDTYKGKFRVDFTTKKGIHLQCVYLPPECLKPLPNKNKQTPRNGNKKGRDVLVVRIASLYENDEEEELVLNIDKKTVDDLFTAVDVDEFLAWYTINRNREELQAKQLEEAERTKLQKAERRTFWMERVEFEKEALDKLVLLLAAEFCRTIRDPSFRSKLLKNEEIKEKLESQAKQTFLELYEGQMPRRVIVKGSHQTNLNGRIGTIEHWDENKGKFRVGLETKKGKNGQDVYLIPEDMEALPFKGKKEKRKQMNPAVSLAFIAPLYNDASLMYEVEKATVDKMLQVEDIDEFLDSLNSQRDEDEHRARQMEEEERIAEEEARKRRNEKRRREDEKWRREREEFHARTERLKEMHRQRKRAQREARDESKEESSCSSSPHDPSSCNCPECKERVFARKLFEEFFSSRHVSGGPSFFFRSGSGFFFVDDDEDDEFDYDSEEDRWDEEFDRMHDEELAEKNANAAELLGVDADATEEEINRRFRRLSLQFHPDKFRPENHEDGTKKEDAEEKFKQLSDARDEMLLYRERTE